MSYKLYGQSPKGCYTPLAAKPPYIPLPQGSDLIARAFFGGGSNEGGAAGTCGALPISSARSDFPLRVTDVTLGGLSQEDH